MEKIITIATGDKIRLAFTVIVSPLKMIQSVERIRGAIEIALFTEVLNETAQKGYWDKHNTICVQVNYSGLKANYSYEITADSLSAMSSEIMKIVHGDLSRVVERDLLYSTLKEPKN